MSSKAALDNGAHPVVISVARFAVRKQSKTQAKADKNVENSWFFHFPYFPLSLERLNTISYQNNSNRKRCALQMYRISFLLWLP